MTVIKKPTLVDQLDHLLNREHLLKRKITDPKESHLRELLEKDLASIQVKIPELRDQISKDPTITKIEDLRIGQKVKFTPSQQTRERLKDTREEHLFGKVLTIVGLHSGEAVLRNTSGFETASEDVLVIDEEVVPSQLYHHAVYDGFRAADFTTKFRKVRKPPA